MLPLIVEMNALPTLNVVFKECAAGTGVLPFVHKYPVSLIEVKSKRGIALLIHTASLLVRKSSVFTRFDMVSIGILQ